MSPSANQPRRNDGSLPWRGCCRPLSHCVAYPLAVRASPHFVAIYNISFGWKNFEDDVGPFDIVGRR
ncbi:hypothetical protein RHECNPAF_25300100 [Rhizobium etli CNPAF512]|nr:hypothetical protein RHECNPAF_25300100 [Rhizobium etli CNPAF512]PWI56344.1 hypothetical protein B5K03_01450 [Rhizobium phaseoli]